MPSGVCVWFLTLLAVTFVSRNDAIKCIQCDKCTESSKEFEPKECSRIHMPERLKAMATFARLSKEYKKAEGWLKTITRDDIKTCHKSVHEDKTTGTVIIDRGCSPYAEDPEHKCEEKDNIVHCIYVCPKDGCNSAPTTLRAGAITMVLVSVIAFVLM